MNKDSCIFSVYDSGNHMPELMLRWDAQYDMTGDGHLDGVAKTGIYNLPNIVGILFYEEIMRPMILMHNDTHPYIF